MQVINLYVLRGAKMEAVPMNNKVPSLLSRYVIPGATNKVATGSFGSVVVAEKETESYIITFVNFLLVAPGTIEYVIRKPLIELNLALEGAIHMETYQRLLLHRQFNAFYNPECKRTVEFSRQRHYSMLTLYLKNDYLSTFAPYYRMVSNFIQTVRFGKEAQMGKLPGSMDFGMQQSVKDIIKVERPCNLNARWLEAKVEYLLLSLIEKLNTSHLTARKTIMLYDSDRILKAAESLVMEPHNLEHLPEIARKWQVNLQRLKNEFKRLIQMPVYAFKIKLRMEQARQQLLETDKSIQEISLSLGYNNAAYFSRVFKKQMGDSPLNYRKSQFSDEM